MYGLTHFLFAFNLLVIFFGNVALVKEIIIFTFVFAVLLDLDFITRMYLLKHEGHNLRTLLQEPLGILFIGLPIGLVLSFLFKSYYLPLTIIPFSSHIFLDYVTVHEVYPFLPFSKKKVKVGFIKQLIPSARDISKNNFLNFKEFNEYYVLLINLVVTVFLIVKIY